MTLEKILKEKLKIKTVPAIGAAPFVIDGIEEAVTDIKKLILERLPPKGEYDTLKGTLENMATNVRNKTLDEVKKVIGEL